jgi:hypothetical protein
LQVSVKGKRLIEHNVMKVYGRVEIYLHAFLKSELEYRSVVSFTPLAYNPRYPLGSRLDESTAIVYTVEKRKIM